MKAPPMTPSCVAAFFSFSSMLEVFLQFHSLLSLRASAEKVAQKWLHAVCTGIKRCCLLYLAGFVVLIAHAIVAPGMIGNGVNRNEI
jgi:hypothetical protein